MQKRYKMKKKSSKKLFRRTAGRSHRFNSSSRPMRGGIRM